MVLLWGIEEDSPLFLVYEELLRRRLPVFLINQREFDRYRFELSVLPKIEGKIVYEKQCIDIGLISSVYIRPYDFRKLPQLRDENEKSEKWGKAFSMESSLLLFSEIAPVRVINRPSAMISNNSKPFQLKIIKEHGFCIPETLITTDPECVSEFRRKHSEVIYKSISSIRSIVSRLGGESDGRLEYVKWCPTQFQQYINGVDYRVHVIGEKIFACKIISDSSDYRYSRRTSLYPCTIPPEVEEKCFNITRHLGLNFSGIDLRLTSEGKWYCFEVNPSPGYSYFETNTGQKISHAVTDYLAGK